MSIRTSIFLFTLLLACAWGKYEFVNYEHQLEKAEYPENLTTLESLKEFVKLVEEHKLNVSLIVSSGKNYEDGNLKEAVAMTLTLPVNQESVTSGTLNKEAFVKLAEVANKEKLTVAGSISKDNELTVISTNRKGVPVTKALKIFTGIKNGKTGFVFDEENYVAQYTFVTHGADGKNTTTKVFYGDVDVEVVSKSDNIDDNKLNIIKKAVVDGIFTNEDEVTPKAIVAILGKVLPGHDWDAASEVGEHNYIDSDTYVLLKIVNDNYLVYSN